MALGLIILRTLRFTPVSIIPPVLHTHLHLYSALTRRTTGRSLGTFQKSNVLSKIVKHWIEKYFHLVFESLISSSKSPKQKLLFRDTLRHKDSSRPFQVNVHFSYPVSRSYKRNYIWISSQPLWLDTFKDVTGYAFFCLLGDLNYIIYFAAMTSALRFFP
jgi:hypothetical protein